MAAEITGKIYNYFFKTGSGFAITVLLGAMVYERTVQIACEHIWETRNQGKLYHHIKDKFPPLE